MKKLYLIIGLNLIIFNISNAQVFDWASWTTGATSATLSNGNCNMSVNVVGSLFQTTAPRFDDAGVTYSPTNGTSLALDHNWANLTSSTSVTMNFSASAKTQVLIFLTSTEIIPVQLSAPQPGPTELLSPQVRRQPTVQ
jgi:hypothetical protein